MVVESKPEPVELYHKIRATVKRASGLPQNQFEKELQKWRDKEKECKGDNDFFRLLVEITFHSGFKSSTANKKMKFILDNLGDYERVKELNFDDVEDLCKQKGMIRNPSKICATILNARAFHRLIMEYGSFKNYLNDYGFRTDDWDDGMDNLAKNLSEQFYQIGPITVYHFLMDIGAFVIKPDRQILALFSRLKLLDSTKKDAKKKAIRIGRDIAKEVNENIRVIDIILVSMGSGADLGLTRPICKNDCEKCQVSQWCKDFKN